LNCNTVIGQEVYVVGDFNQWDTNAGIKLQTCSKTYPMWTNKEPA